MSEKKGNRLSNFHGRRQVSAVCYGDLLSLFYPRQYLVIESIASLLLWRSSTSLGSYNQLLGVSEGIFSGVSILENLGWSFPCPTDLSLGCKEKCVLLGRRPYFPNFNENYLSRVVQIQSIKAAPLEFNSLNFWGFSNSSLSIRIIRETFSKCRYGVLTLELIIQGLRGKSSNLPLESFMLHQSTWRFESLWV